MRKTRWALVLAVIAVATVASAEDELTSLSYISYLERYATIVPVHADDSLEAAINMPLAAGDRIDTAREARIELVLADGTLVWVDEYTTLSLDAVAYSRDILADQTVLYLAEGSLMVEVTTAQPEAEPLRIDGADATVYLMEPGLYRVDALRDGGLRLEVWEGLAEAATTAGGVLIRSSSATEVAGGSSSPAEPRVTWGDAFARWIEQRRQVFEGPSSEHVDPRHARQASQLDAYGSWIYVDDLNTWAWQPTVSSGWAPYTAGRWYWTSVGWSWVSYEPWGWLPYHYGSWYFSGGVGWVWSWHPYWSPAWVRWAAWPGYIGWCPYGYYDSWYWSRYDCYGCGYYPPGHYPPGGGGGAKPPRTDVTAPREAADRRLSAQPAPGSVDKVRPQQVALNVNGKVDVSQIDRRGWNVVPQDDFASPRLARVVRPGEVAMRGVDGVEGVVSSGPIITDPPTRTSASQALSRHFDGVRQTSATDVTPILARRGDLSPDTARELAKPGNPAALASGARTANPTAAASASPANDPARTAERMALESALRNAPPAPDRDVAARRGGGGRLPTAERPTSNPFLSRTVREPAVTPRIGSGPATRGTVGSSRSPLVRRPSSSTVIPPTRSGGSSVLRPSTPSSRPVIVPRTAPTRITPGVRSPSGSMPRSISRGSSSSGTVRSRPSVGSSRGSSMPRSSSVSRGSSSSSSSSGGAKRSTGATRKQ
jgi:hypothetical protein